MKIFDCLLLQNGKSQRACSKFQNKKKLSSGFWKLCFRAEILRCNNQVVQKLLQVLPKHGNMGQNILVRLL